MRFNVITPLARFENFPALIDMLEPLGVAWHVITDEDAKESHTIIKEFYPWIHFYVCPNKEVQFFERCNFAINWFLDNHKLISEDMYSILNDDDAYEPDYFSKIFSVLDIVDHSIIITSMERGHNIPASAVGCRAHPPSKLWGTPENMRVGGVGIEQIMLKGRILSQFRIPLLNNGDGRFIVSIINDHSPGVPVATKFNVPAWEVFSDNDVGYIPLATVWFNYFEEGRWNK